MENEQIQYHLILCENEKCRKKFPEPIQILQVPNDVKIRYRILCPYCLRLQLLSKNALKDPMSKKELKSWQLVENYPKGSVVFFWEGEDEKEALKKIKAAHKKPKK